MRKDYIKPVMDVTEIRPTLLFSGSDRETENVGPNGSTSEGYADSPVYFDEGEENMDW